MGEPIPDSDLSDVRHQRRPSRWSRRKWLGAVVVVVVIAAFFVWHSIPSTEQLLDQARTNERDRNFETALSLSVRVLAREPDSVMALEIAGAAAAKLDRHDESLRYCARLPNSSRSHVDHGIFGAGAAVLELRELSADEQSLVAALHRESDHLFARDRLGFIQGISGRRWESNRHLLFCLKNRSFSVAHLVWLGDVERVVTGPDDLKACLDISPNDPLAQLGLACVAIEQNDPGMARELLAAVLNQRPGLLEAHARLGSLLIESPEEFDVWHKQLPDDADRHPGVWIARARFADFHGQPRAAVRCFGEALRREPNHRLANYQLGNLLAKLNKPDASQLFLQRAERLYELSEVIFQVHVNSIDNVGSPVLMKRAAELTESLGRLWEAWAWSVLAQVVDPSCEWAGSAMNRIGPLLNESLAQTTDEHDPSRTLDVSSWPLPDLASIRHGESPDRSPHAMESTIQFEDVAPQAGVEFTYFSSADETTPGKRLFEITGGGVGVLDYDVDGWPDLYLTQGCPWPLEEHPGEMLDQMFRNLADGQFENVTQQAGLTDDGYGQGVAIGDYNSDGFPDIFVGNIGDNRLYRNEGDGTFTDVTDEAGLAGQHWTTSCALADLNGDGWADIYVVNYLRGENVYSRICRPGGVPGSCHPREFDASPDQVWQNDGDGGFRDTTAESGITAEHGKGLGLVVADLHGNGLLSVFVANDSVANHFYLNHASDRGDAPPSFQEQALISGIAFDSEGKAQACMGIASGDVDRDGLLDFFVTNFFQENNTLYRQDGISTFVDAIHQSGLQEPGFELLGFGTQFLDADLDGYLDLVVANGHVDDYSYLGYPCEMRPQLFHNTGSGRFHELPDSGLGPYFQGKVLGRGLATADWNRDGRPDFAVSHLDAPVAILTNRTPTDGHYLTIQFRGVISSRDAIGTTVLVRGGDERWIAQLTAGDGYQAANQRRVHFGLGDVDRIDELSIRWPSGMRQEFPNPDVDREIIVVEGRGRVFAVCDE